MHQNYNQAIYLPTHHLRWEGIISTVYLLSVFLNKQSQKTQQKRKQSEILFELMEQFLDISFPFFLGPKAQGP